MRAETCEYCGKPIPMRTGLKNYCDPICKAKDLRAVTKCKTCGRSISYLLCRPTPKYCSVECVKADRIKNFCAVCAKKLKMFIALRNAMIKCSKYQRYAITAAKSLRCSVGKVERGFALRGANTPTFTLLRLVRFAAILLRY